MHEQIETHAPERFAIPDVMLMCRWARNTQHMWVHERLMRWAVHADDRYEASSLDDARAIVCATAQLLFIPHDGSTRWTPRVGDYEHLGGAAAEAVPLSPVHIHRGVPFLLADFRYAVLAGVPEPCTAFLCRLMRDAQWVPRAVDDWAAEHASWVAEDLVRNGPWRRPLEVGEIDWLRAQLRPLDRIVKDPSS